MNVYFILGQILVIWLMAAGLAYAVRGPRGFGRVVRWPLVNGFRLVRRMIGGIFVALGRMIRG